MKKIYCTYCDAKLTIGDKTCRACGKDNLLYDPIAGETPRSIEELKKTLELYHIPDEARALFSIGSLNKTMRAISIRKVRNQYIVSKTIDEKGKQKVIYEGVYEKLAVSHFHKYLLPIIKERKCIAFYKKRIYCPNCNKMMSRIDPVCPGCGYENLRYDPLLGKPAETVK